MSKFRENKGAKHPKVSVREEIISVFSKEQKRGLSWILLNYRRKNSVLCSFKNRKWFFPRRELSADEALPHAARRKINIPKLSFEVWLVCRSSHRPRGRSVLTDHT